MREEWTEWLPETVLWQPLITPEGELRGGLLFMRDGEWTKAERATLNQAADAYGHALGALSRRRFWRRNTTKRKPRYLKLLAALLGTLLLMTPLRLSVLAPMEIIPADPMIVSAPMNGVIKKIAVKPGQAVKTGQPLFSLDDVALRNEHAVARKTLEVARAEYVRASQKAFADSASRAQVLMLKAQIDQKTVEADYMAELLQSSQIHAAQDGIAIFTDAADWDGKPVAVGEKVMILADPKRIEAEMQLPVADAINLEIGAEVLLFLNIAPLKPLKATLRRASYQAQVTPAGVLAFQLQATLKDSAAAPRIGLHGTAKIYGRKVTLFYYLMRKPLATLRQLLGI